MAMWQDGIIWWMAYIIWFLSISMLSATNRPGYHMQGLCFDSRHLCMQHRVVFQYTRERERER